MTCTSEFDWNARNDTDHCIVVQHQPVIAVYTNPHDEVVIRDQYGDEDDFVYVTKDSAKGGASDPLPGRYRGGFDPLG